jgi:hypothetical protein
VSLNDIDQKLGGAQATPEIDKLIKAADSSEKINTANVDLDESWNGLLEKAAEAKTHTQTEPVYQFFYESNSRPKIIDELVAKFRARLELWKRAIAGDDNIRVRMLLPNTNPDFKVISASLDKILTDIRDDTNRFLRDRTAVNGQIQEETYFNRFSKIRTVLTDQANNSIGDEALNAVKARMVRIRNLSDKVEDIAKNKNNPVIANTTFDLGTEAEIDALIERLGSYLGVLKKIGDFIATLGTSNAATEARKALLELNN